MNQPAIPADVQALIEGSGNTFHAKVAQFLKDKGWLVRISPYYLDQTQGKAREIDLIAEKAWSVTGYMDSKIHDEVIVRLFVECKFVSSNCVLWLADKDRASAQSLVYDTWPFRENNAFTKDHHYLAQCPRVAKTFASDKRGNEYEWMYKALNQVLHARIAMENHALMSPCRGPRSAPIVLNYPVIACSSFDKFYETSFFGGSATSRVEDNFQLEVQYAYVDDTNGDRRDQYFLIDVVEFNRLNDFIASVEKDADLAVSMVEPT